MSKIPTARIYYWRNFFRGMLFGPYRFEIMMRLMGMYLHFEPHTRHTLANIQKQIDLARQVPRNPLVELPLKSGVSVLPVKYPAAGLDNAANT